MNCYEVKFSLNLDGHDYSIDDVFNNAKGILNWQFDEDFNAKLTDNDIEYQVKDISNFNEEDVEEIINFLILPLKILLMFPFIDF